MKLSLRYYGVLLTVAMISSYGCRSSKVMTTHAPDLSLSEVLDTLIQKRPVYHDFYYAKAKVKYNGEESRIGGRAILMMIPDSLIWMNFKKLSVEGARILISPEQAQVLYRQDDLYESIPTATYLERQNIHLSFAALQAILGRDFQIPTAEQVTSYSSQPNKIELSWTDIDYRYFYRLDRELRFDQIQISDIFDRSIVIDVSDHDEAGLGRSFDILIRLPDGDATEISIHLLDVVLDYPRSIKFEIPDHYTRIP